jgi:transposase-like protein
MPPNNIQFQKGLSLREFQQQYGTEKQCREMLFKARWPKGYVCPHCGNNRFYRLQVRPVYQCCHCRHQHSLISKTIFASSKLPLTVWFLAIFFITQSKEGMAALPLSRYLRISYNAAQRMKHKIQIVMKKADDCRPLTQLVQIDDAYWGGRQQGCKRGRGAAGKTPFIAAVSRNTKGYPVNIRFSRVSGFTSDEIRRWSNKHLAPKRAVFTDGLACFNSLSVEGHFHWAFITQGGKNVKTSKLFNWINIIIGNVKNSIRGTYHGIDHRHLPRYLAEFCYRFNHRFNLAKMLEKLIYHSAHTPPIPQRELSLAEDWW